MNVPQLEGLPLVSPREHLFHAGADPISYNQDVLSGAVRRLWLKKWWLLFCAVVGLIAAIAVLSLAPKRYEARALIRLEFVTPNQASATRVQLDAAALVESEARVLRSPNLMEKVIARLDLLNAPEAPPSDEISKLLAQLFGSQTSASESRAQAIDDLTARMIKRSSIDNDTKAYLIGIRHRAASPAVAAKVTNAIAETYILERRFQSLLSQKARVTSELARLEEVYGNLHPAVLGAQARLEDIGNRIRDANEAEAGLGPVQLEQFSVEIAVPAKAPAYPSFPVPQTVYPLTIFLFVVAGVIAALIWDQRDRGFSSEKAVYRATGARCIGMIPAFGTSLRITRRRGVEDEACRAVSIALSLERKHDSCRVIVITSPLPDEGLLRFSEALAGAVSKEGKQVLVIESAWHLERDVQTKPAPNEIGNVPAVITIGHGQSYRRSGSLSGCEFDSARVTGMLESAVDRARTKYGVIIINVPAALTSSKVIEAARLADAVVLAVRWNAIPRQMVADAVSKLRDSGNRVTGIVLTEVNLARHLATGVRDQAYYQTRHSAVPVDL